MLRNFFKGKYQASLEDVQQQWTLVMRWSVKRILLSNPSSLAIAGSTNISKDSLYLFAAGAEADPVYAPVKQATEAMMKAVQQELLGNALRNGNCRRHCVGGST